jgi:hypothetical protein
VVTYELADGSAWGRTLIYTVSGGTITGVAMYRYARA